MNFAIKAPDEAIEFIEVDKGQPLEFYQGAVGGRIEQHYLLTDDGSRIAFFCNEDGKSKNLPLNFPLYLGNEEHIPPEHRGKIYEYVVGTVIFTGNRIDKKGMVVGLSEEEIKSLEEHFSFSMVDMIRGYKVVGGQPRELFPGASDDLKNRARGLVS